MKTTQPRLTEHNQLNGREADNCHPQYMTIDRLMDLFNNNDSFAQSVVNRLSNFTPTNSNPNDGSSGVNAAVSGLAIKQNYPDSPSGLYWIDPDGSGNPYQVYVDMVTDGGGWTQIAFIKHTYSGEHFRVFDDSIASTVDATESYHVASANNGLLDNATEIRASMEKGVNFSTAQMNTWPYDVKANIVEALRQAIKNTHNLNNGDIVPTNVSILNGSFLLPNMYTYGRTSNSHATGFRFGQKHSSLTGHSNLPTFATLSYTGAPEGDNGIGYRGVFYGLDNSVGHDINDGVLWLR